MKEKIMQMFKSCKEWVKKFFSDKTIAFYIALGAAVLSIATAIVYVAIMSGTYMSWIAFALLLVSAAAFIALSILKYSKIGVAVMAALNFTALILFLAKASPYVIDNISGTLSGATFIAMIVSAALIFVSFAVANVTVWLQLNKNIEIINTDAQYQPDTAVQN